MNIEDAMFTSHFRATMGEVMTGAEQLKGLAQTIDGFCDLSAHADAEEMRQGSRRHQGDGRSRSPDGGERR